MPSYSLQKDGTFVIKDYNQAGPFSNFLPGIAGSWGVPLWVFYVNRGQAISSFGLKDKDGAISEFFPANKAYSLTPNFGFRTFIKNNKGDFYEPFSIEKKSSQISQILRVKSASLEIADQNLKFGLATKVKYFNFSNQPVGALARKVTFTNISDKTLDLEILDGLARIIPYGTANGFLKEMSRTVEAWMHAYPEKNYALFRLIVDPTDVSQTTYIQGANFNYSFYPENGKKIHPTLVVDPAKAFGTNLSLTYPAEFVKKKFNPKAKQILSGKTPSAFSYLQLKIKPNRSITLYNLFGAAFSPEPIKKIIAKLNTNLLEKQEKENNQIIADIKGNAFCRSSSYHFDHYLSSTYLDNILRGGYPYQPHQARPEQKVLPYYIFSRKHGDPERDYNYFNLSPSYFSEGQGNYRDVNQNRRLDLFFKPALGANNIVYFLNLIQADGYNPLVVKGEKLYFSPGKAKELLKKYKIKKQKFLHLLTKGFYLGDFFQMLLPEDGVKDREQLTFDLLKDAVRKTEAAHGEGYWIDHWRYNLDLIESFLMFYPDKLTELFFHIPFNFYDDKYKIKPRPRRYVLRNNRVFQGESLEVDKKKAEIIKNRKQNKHLLRDAQGEVYTANLAEKLLVLILNKAASFDPAGLGLEMEAAKPGWCDSLNGLPALFGSSLCETFELKRAALLLKTAITQPQPSAKSGSASGGKSTPVSQTILNFFNSLQKLIKTYNRSKAKDKDFNYWDKANKLKENFRQNSFYQLSANTNNLNLKKIEEFLTALIKKIDKNLAKAKDQKTKLYYTYFTYRVTDYKKRNHAIYPQKFERHNLPLFLEGIVHALRCHCEVGTKRKSSVIARSKATKQSLYQNVKKSALYDQKLKMYKLNDSLAKESLDIGRSRIFNPGWLENESIWLHMEYKYLLEILKGGLYPQFFLEFKNAAVCYQNPNTYGRSILENSSFLAGSSHPDKTIHGKGFVARLTGATAELLHIWILLSLGHHPFSLDKKGELVFSPSPILEANLFTAKNTYSFKAFSKTLIIYHNPKKLDTFAKNCKIKKIDLQLADKTVSFKQKVKGKFAEAIRNQQVTKIDIHLG